MVIDKNDAAILSKLEKNECVSYNDLGLNDRLERRYISMGLIKLMPGLAEPNPDYYITATGLEALREYNRDNRIISWKYFIQNVLVPVGIGVVSALLTKVLGL